MNVGMHLLSNTASWLQTHGAPMECTKMGKVPSSLRPAHPRANELKRKKKGPVTSMHTGYHPKKAQAREAFTTVTKP